MCIAGRRAPPAIWAGIERREITVALVPGGAALGDGQCTLRRLLLALFVLCAASTPTKRG